MKKSVEINRRSFLKHIAAGTAAVAGASAIVKPAKAKSAATPGRQNEILYHESKNFKKYYKSL